MKVGLVLGAGGARGMCHLGVLKALAENNIAIDCVAGSSIGAMVGGMLAAGVSLDEMERMSNIAKQGFIMDFNTIVLKRRPGMFQARRVMKLMEQVLGDKRIEDCAVNFCATAVDVETGEPVIFRSGVLRDAIRASMAIPVVFTPWEIEGRLYMDGGVLCRLPIESVRDMGADIIIAVDALGPVRISAAPRNVLHMVQRYYDIADWEISKNKIITADVLITPDLGDKSPLAFKNNGETVEKGYKAATEMMPRILEALGR